MNKSLLSIILVFLLNITTFAQTFNEVSNVAGIDHTFKQHSQMGGGAVFFDYDNDGWEDLYITSGINKDHLYKNQGDGTFTQINAAWLDITEDYYTTGVVSGDINNDGFRDLFVTTWRASENGAITGSLQRNLLFINNGNGTFKEDGEVYNLSDTTFSMGGLMFDYNNDGYLDIYVINYIETAVPVFGSNGTTVGFDHECFENILYRNNGNNTFTNVSSTTGVNNNGCGLAAMPTDFDKDNDQDIYVANDFGEFVMPNAILENQHPSNEFLDVSTSTNMDVGIYAMGISYSDYDKDQDYDYYITNLGRNVLLKNNGSQVFTDVSTEAGVENTYAENSNDQLFTTGWGTGFFDVNNDTWPDLFVANGRVPSADFIATGEDDPNKLYMNNKDGTFNDVSNSAGVADYNRGRGMAYSDYDKDGDIDVVVVVQDGSQDTNAKTTLYQNQLNPNSSSNTNWSQIELIGTDVNFNAIGARVEITVNGEKLIQQVHGQGSHCSQHSLVLHFGLADATNIEELKVIWSASNTQVFENLEVNKRYNLVEGGNLSVSNFNKDVEVTVYPNPTKEKLFFTNIKEEVEVEIYTIQGRFIQKEKLSSTKNFLDLKNYSAGTYIVKLLKNNSEVYNRLFIVE